MVGLLLIAVCCLLTPPLMPPLLPLLLELLLLLVLLLLLPLLPAGATTGLPRTNTLPQVHTGLPRTRITHD